MKRWPPAEDKTMMNHKTTLTIAAALLVVTTTACSRSSDDDVAPVENYSGVTDLPAEQPTAVVSEAPEPAPANTADTNMMAEVPPEAAPAPDEQMMDDASATGMTARASRDAPVADDAGPVEQVEKK
ncbi:hypothetical protein [Sphingomonas mollis]|uniref:Secreted protein n=1 Tax=Sphingomonas mollis TaxID=2795726 RepID=A0ABS0XTM8_9SPHN|nr:hypothetical protein [Sphingomonas sp. BT553]MBJ6123377.1 hypothetical protein [Sphingomonas sp. BT553]